MIYIKNGFGNGSERRKSVNDKFQETELRESSVQTKSICIKVNLCLIDKIPQDMSPHASLCPVEHL